MSANTAITKYTIADISKMDRESRELVGVYSASRIKIGLELARRLKEFEDNRLYLRLDENSYNNFPSYLKSLGVNYKTAREVIGLYETYVLVGGMSIDELAKIEYHKLTTIKPHLFKKEAGEYKLTKPKAELKRWISEAKSDITQEDLLQMRREEEAGDHDHNDPSNWEYITLRVCKVCKLRERVYEKTHTKEIQAPPEAKEF